MDTKHIYWIAGILDGEGCFSFQARTPKIMVASVDLDTVEKIRDFIAPKNILNVSKTVTGKSLYKLTVCGTSAIQWMMTIYVLMSSRRKAKIRSVLQIWKDRFTYKRGNSSEKRLISLFIDYGLTKEQAEIKLLELMAKG